MPPDQVSIPNDNSNGSEGNDNLGLHLRIKEMSSKIEGTTSTYSEYESELRSLVDKTDTQNLLLESQSKKIHSRNKILN